LCSKTRLCYWRHLTKVNTDSTIFRDSAYALRKKYKECHSDPTAVL
jgi:hypothetical protein